MAAVKFTGTSSPNVYTSGQLYSNGNGVYRANADGSFTNVGNGRTTVGSSQDERVSFSTSGGLSLGSGSQGRQNAVAYAGSGAGNSGSATGGGASGPGTAGGGTGARSGSGAGNPGAVTFTPSTRGSVLGGGFLSSKGVGGGTPVFAFGKEIPRDDGWSDAEKAETRWGDGDFLSPTWFYQWGVAGADMLKASTFKGDAAARDLSKAAESMAQYVIDRREAQRVERGWDAYTQDRNTERQRLVETAGMFVTGGGF